MQSKRARKSAKEVNRFFDPTLDDKDAERKLGNKIPRSKRDFSHIVEVADRMMRNKDKSLPREISPIHLKFFQTMAAVALRENVKDVEVVCPDCKKVLTVKQHDSKAEGNSIKALEIGFDRMFPRLASLTHEVNIAGQLNVVTDQLAAVIIKYVPNDKVALCSAELVALIEKVQNNEQQRQIQQVNAGGLSIAV
jgi:hypothetical protein